MDFTKWNSIENHYQKGIFERWIYLNPELNNIDVEITEKIHGANFSILVSPCEKAKFASRNSVLEEDAKFYGFQEVFEREEYVGLIKFLEVLSRKHDAEIQLYGELYGGKIQKGVFYGTEKNFRWYSLRWNGAIYPPQKAAIILNNFLHLKAPAVGVFNVGGDLIKFIDEVETEFQSNLTPKEYTERNICEGVVMVPYEQNFWNQSSLLLIKKKNEEFKDKSHARKHERVEKVIPENVQELTDEALSYINENRTNDLQSKNGEFNDIKDISKFAKEYFNDLFSDFEKDNYTEWHCLDKLEQGYIKKVIGKNIFQELKISLLR